MPNPNKHNKKLIRIRDRERELVYDDIVHQFGEITQNKGHYRRSRPFKVTDFGTNRKLIYNFLLVISTNFLLSCTVSDI